MRSNLDDSSFARRLASPQVAQQLLGNQFNPRIRLTSTKDPKIIWYNPRMGLISENASSDKKADSLSKLAQRIGLKVEEDPKGISFDGIVDRYGGRGLGRNGGSGRSALVGDTYLKGVGKTPLLGRSTDAGHASGGAYLEECAKEVLFSEIVSAEFPFGCVPSSAICLTGETVIWSTSSGNKCEHQCILARPAFLRPAHFEKAVGFDPLNLSDLSVDESRVALAMRYLKEEYQDMDRVKSILIKLWFHWAEQIAYAFSHRMSCGGLSTANVAIDGRWVDFGAWASLPGWGRYASAPRVESFGQELSILPECIRVFYQNMVSYAILDGKNTSYVDQIIQGCVVRYQKRMAFEILRVLGLTRKQSLRLLEGAHAAEIINGLSEFLSRFQRENLSIIYETEMPSVIWCHQTFWHEGRRSATSLAGVLGGELGIYENSSEGRDLFSHLLDRAHFIGRPRISLYRDKLKSNLYNLLEVDVGSSSISYESFCSIINRMICEGRRDTLFEYDAGIPVGFARSCMFEMALFLNCKESIYLGVMEWSLVKAYPRGHKLILGKDIDRALGSLQDQYGEVSRFVMPKLDA